MLVHYVSSYLHFCRILLRRSEFIEEREIEDNQFFI